MANKKEIIILDSNIIIDVYNGEESTYQDLRTIGYKNLCISIITYGETIFGALNKKDLKKWKKHLKKYLILHVNDAIGNIFMGLMNKYSLSHKISVPDAFIAATAIYYKYPLYTNNTKDFNFIPNLKLYSVQI